MFSITDDSLSADVCQILYPELYVQEGIFPSMKVILCPTFLGFVLCTCIKRNYRSRNVNPTFCETDLDCHAGKGKCIELLGRCFESQFDYNRGGEVGVNHFPTQSIHI